MNTAKIKLTLAQVTDALERGYVSPLNSKRQQPLTSTRYLRKNSVKEINSLLSVCKSVIEQTKYQLETGLVENEKPATVEAVKEFIAYNKKRNLDMRVVTCNRKHQDTLYVSGGNNQIFRIAL